MKLSKKNEFDEPEYQEYSQDSFTERSLMETEFDTYQLTEEIAAFVVEWQMRICSDNKKLIEDIGDTALMELGYDHEVLFLARLGSGLTLPHMNERFKAILRRVLSNTESLDEFMCQAWDKCNFENIAVLALEYDNYLDIASLFSRAVLECNGDKHKNDAFLTYAIPKIRIDSIRRISIDRYEVVQNILKLFLEDFQRYSAIISGFDPEIRNQIILSCLSVSLHRFTASTEEILKFFASTPNPSAVPKERFQLLEFIGTTFDSFRKI